MGQARIDRRRFLFYGAALAAAPVVLGSLSSRKAKAAVNYSHPAWSVGAPVYEMNPYFHAQSTRLVDIIPHLDAIADLGVGILWIMPVYQRGASSMYCIQDYTSVDTDLGTIDDLKALVNRAHALGIKVILDFVPLHTSNNHPWIQQHPGWYDRDSSGNIVHRWRDTSQLAWFNSNATLREELWAEMQRIVTYWVRNADVDGFRWDVGLDIPEGWFARVREALQSIKPVFFLGEGWPASLHPENDMSYDWDLPKRFKEIGVGGKAATVLDTHLGTENTNFGAITPTPYRMRYTLNHDISNPNEGEFADYGGRDATLAFEVLAATIGPRTKPMIYSGQEVGIRTALGWTNRVTTNPDYGTSPLRAFYRRLFRLYKDNPALHPGSPATKFSSTNNDRIYAFGRTADGGTNQVVVVTNLSGTGRGAGVTVPTSFQGAYTDVETGVGVNVGPNYNPTLAAWGYRILTRQGMSTPTSQTVTFAVAAAVDDQQVGRVGTAYPPSTGTFSRQDAAATVEASKNREGYNYVTRNLLLRWDTSSIPDNATITKATLQFYCTNAASRDRSNFVAEYWGWNGASDSDWSGAVPAAPILSLPIANIVKGGWNSVDITDRSGIGKAGWTLIRCHISGGAPTGYNYVVSSAFENSSPEARLIVKYTTP